MAVGGNFTNCNCGPETQTCESPTQPVATVGLCLAYGTPIAVTIVRDCAGTVTSEGWINLVTGQYTAGPAPADAGCVDTLCRQLCDDTDGDGQADATYSQLWCIKADGSAELVLTYQDDPSTPYTPVSPVDCTYGCAETETLTLCDASGPFLRRYTWLQDTATFRDFALDGSTPHVVTGTVGACAGQGGGGTPCTEQTIPAATLGLCLADGTPIAVVITRDCATSTVTQDGWLNLLTGAYSVAHLQRARQRAATPERSNSPGCFVTSCRTARSPGLVLVEYEYNPDGSLASVRLVDPATGGTYTLQGELRNCPAGTEQPDLDLTVLCDTAADGTVKEFVRDYRRDDNGQVTGHTDYTLDGQPYTPAGTVAVCAQPCRNTSTLLVCDLPTDGIEGAPTHGAVLRRLQLGQPGQRLGAGQEQRPRLHHRRLLRQEQRRQLRRRQRPGSQLPPQQQVRHPPQRREKPRGRWRPRRQLGMGLAERPHRHGRQLRFRDLLAAGHRVGRCRNRRKPFPDGPRRRRRPSLNTSDLRVSAGSVASRRCWMPRPGQVKPETDERLS
ncbi:hypothetical protein ACW9TO_39195, partial [Streptomyces sp. ATMOS53]